MDKTNIVRRLMNQGWICFNLGNLWQKNEYRIVFDDGDARKMRVVRFTTHREGKAIYNVMAESVTFR